MKFCHGIKQMNKATEIRCHPNRNALNVRFEDGSHYQISAECLRVESPSAEVQGHGADTKIIVPDKENVKITAIHPVGNYAIRISFDDGHDTGIYSWDILAHLGAEQDRLMAEYRANIAQMK